MSEDITQLQIDILNELRTHPRSAFPIRGLSEMFGLSAQRVNRAVKELENWGYALARDPNGDITYLASPDVLFPHEIEFGLKTRLFTGNIYSFDRVSSTNTLAHKYAEKDEPEGTLVIAERQTAGKGRLGRSWHSPAKRGLYFSLILRPQIPPSAAPGISLIAALSVAAAMRELPGVAAQIKWPNDVLCHDRKVCGVLTELAAELDRVRYVIVGIGINVNHEAADFPADLRAKASSLKMITGAPVDRIQLLRLLLANFEKYYLKFLSDGLKSAIKSIRSYSSVIGKTITFRLDGRYLRGTAVGIDLNGMLIVEVDGKRLTLGSGEISLEENY